MALEKLTKQDLMGNHRPSGATNDYAKFLRNLKPGEGGRTTVAKEGVSRQTIKARIKKAAEVAGTSIKFRRAPVDTVIFEVIVK